MFTLVIIEHPRLQSIITINFTSMLVKRLRVGHETSDEDLIAGGISSLGWDPHAGVSHTDGSLGAAH